MYGLTTLTSHNQAISSLILSGSDIRVITYCTIVSSFIGLLACWLLIPYFEVGGTVIGYGIYGLIQILFYYLYYWPKKMHIDSGKVFKCSFLPSVMAGVVAMLLVRYGLKRFLLPVNNDWIELFLEEIVFTLLYIGVVYAFILNAKDKSLFFKLIRKHA